MIATLNTDNVCLDDLPGLLREMAGLIGLSATLVIVQHYGGVRLYVPITMTPEHILSRLIGFETALKLSSEYGGLTHFDIPRAVAALRSARNAEISDKFIKGKSVRELALYYMMTERGITKILANQGIGMDDRQADLF
jgi:hypothetical protein